MKTAVAMSAAVLVTVLGACGAEELSLPDAQKLLFNNNRDVQIAEAKYLKSLVQVSEVKSSYYPTAYAYANYGYQSKANRLVSEMDLSPAIAALYQGMGLPAPTSPVVNHIDEPIGDHDRFEMGVDLSYLLFTGMSRKNSVLALQAASTGYCLGLITVKDRLSLMLGLMYFNWELALKKVEVQKTFIDQVSEYVVQMRNLFEGGVEPRSKVLEATARLESAKVELLSAESTVDSIRLELADFLQLDDTAIVPRQYDYELSNDVVESRPRAYRPEVVVLDSTIAQIGHTERALLGQRFPALYVMAGYRVGNPGIVMGGDEVIDWGVAGLQLKWTIYDGQKNWAQRDQLRHDIDILKKERKKQLAMWEKTAAQQRLQIQKAHRVKAAAELALAAAEAFAGDLANALSAGVVSSTDYLNALGSVAEARFRVARAETLRKTAALQLAFALGENMEF